MAIQIPEEFSNPNSWGSILNDNWQEIKDRLTGVTQTGVTKDVGVFQELRTGVAEIDNTDSPYTTSGESQIEADTSGGAVAVEIASADIPASGEAGRSVTIVNTDTGDLTISTEGTELIQPTGAGSITIPTAYAYVELQLIAGVVYIDRAKDFESLAVADLTTPPTGTYARLSTTQTVADNTIAQLGFDTEATRGNVGDLLNASNEVVVPEGYSWARTILSTRWATPTDIDIFRCRINSPNATDPGWGTRFIGSPLTVDRYKTPFPWHPVSQGDVITAEVRHQSGASRDIESQPDTGMEVWLR